MNVLMTTETMIASTAFLFSILLFVWFELHQNRDRGNRRINEEIRKTLQAHKKIVDEYRDSKKLRKL